MRRKSLLFFILFLLSFSAYSIEIYSNYLEYDQKNNRIIANGNVTVKYQEVNLNAGSIKFDINNDFLQAEENVILKRNDKEIKADKILYEFDENKGLLNNTSFKFRNITFYSNLMKLNKNSMQLLNTNFTLCEKENRLHFNIKTNELIFNDNKKIFMKNIYLYINDKKIIKLPYFTLPITKKEKKLTLFSYGINPKDIIYAKSYYTSPVYKLGKIESTLYLPVNSERIQYTISFEKENIYKLLYERRLNRLTSKKDIYIRREPEVLFENKHQYKYFSCNNLLKLGKIYDEEVNVKSNRITTKIELKSNPINLNTIYLDIAGYYSFSIYDKSSYQDRSYSISFYNKNFRIDYIIHKLSGQTPFYFDEIDFKKELHNTLGLKTKKSIININTRYDLENNKIYDNIISMKYKLTDCITIAGEYFKKKDKLRIELILLPLKEFISE